MNCLLALLTGYSVMAHAVFGCCDHGLAAKAGYPTGCCCRSIAWVKKAAMSVDQPSAKHKKADVAAVVCSSSAGQLHECRHASCHWLTSSRTIVSDLTVTTAPAISAAVPPSVGLPSSFSSSRADDFSGTETPSLRLHLLVGVLLV